MKNKKRLEIAKINLKIAKTQFFRYFFTAVSGLWAITMIPIIFMASVWYHVNMTRYYSLNKFNEILSFALGIAQLDALATGYKEQYVALIIERSVRKALPF